MSGAGKTRAEVFVQPKNSRPLKKTAIVLYASRAELKKQIQAYAATVWISAKRIDVDDNSLEILVDGVAVANYRIHIPGSPAHAAPVQVVTKRRGAPARHALAQIAVTAAGLILTLAAGPHINGEYLAGAALAVFGIYRLGLGVQRRELQA